MLSDVLSAARTAGLVGITAIGTTVETSQRCLELAKTNEFVFAAAGIHPNQCSESTLADWAQIKTLASQPEVVAIGETGLDRHWDYCPFEIQQTWFARHIELSFETEKPLVIHMRDCEPDILAMLQQHQRNGRINGIMHSFAGCWETAEACLKLGCGKSPSGFLRIEFLSRLIRLTFHRILTARFGLTSPRWCSTPQVVLQHCEEFQKTSLDPGKRSNYDSSIWCSFLSPLRGLEDYRIAPH